MDGCDVEDPMVDERSEGTAAGPPAPRRYSDDEVESIFAEATRSVQPAAPRRTEAEGLTLADLHEIGREIGVDEAAITHAAAALEVRGEPQPRRRFLGFPVGVGRTADLPGPLSDREWERLVVDLRDTFNARGNLRREGSLREWWNGNLHALVEPTPTGQRIRLRTTSSRIQSLLTVGIASFAIAFMVGAILLLTGQATLTEILPGLGILLGVGVWGVGFGAFESFRWAPLRERQMKEIASRAADLAAGAEVAALPEGAERALPGDVTE